MANPFRSRRKSNAAELPPSESNFSTRFLECPSLPEDYVIYLSLALFLLEFIYSTYLLFSRVSYDGVGHWMLFSQSYASRMPKWRSPRAAVIPNFHLPMRSYEVKNRMDIWNHLLSQMGLSLVFTSPLYMKDVDCQIACRKSVHYLPRSKLFTVSCHCVKLYFHFIYGTRTNVDDIKALRLITAIKTPYLPDGRFDLEAYDALVNMQIEDGVEGVIVGGTTGEGQLMSWDEHIMLIGHTVNCFGASIKVIGNTGSNSTREAIHATEQGFAVGMHAALHINPYYGKTSLEGLVSHFDSVLPMGPTIIYNVPSRTGQDIPPRVIQTVAHSTNLAGVKECVGNDRVEQYTNSGVVVWSGNDDQCHDSRWDYGATGVISVTSNLVPEPNPIGLNTALAQLGVVRPVFRLPYVPLPLAKRVEFVNIVKELGRENFIGEKDVQVLDDDDFVLIGRY
ncbi:hypothetical protein DH2020_000539 [Rehmannia glutinosa]|uniref:4-hydroxy-tetrahydrodipicolinate synthase n=1 Tax=Rehmannia glutinosa TaxID=99300 RepID=A0ABR0XWS8_REHGL